MAHGWKPHGDFYLNGPAYIGHGVSQYTAFAHN
jgi:hypothetical protein